MEDDFNIKPILRTEGKRIIDVFGSNKNPTERMKELNDHFSGIISNIHSQINILIYDSKEKETVLKNLEESMMILNKAIFHFDKE